MINAMSDVLTLPTEEMWEAMRVVETNLWWGREDPSVRSLENQAAEMTGKEDALLTLTGTMGNLLALMTHCTRGDQVVMEATCHTAWSEEWGLAYIGGLYPRLIKGKQGVMDPAQVEEAITKSVFGHLPRTSLVCLENTHNAAGGTTLSAERTKAICEVAHRHGAAVHIDGARIFNSAVAQNTDIKKLVEPADTVMFSLNKGLSGPAGALLCGSAETMRRAHINAKRIGGTSFHKAGIFAAAGLVALETMVDRLADDHKHAWQFAEDVNEIDKAHVDLSSVQTNIVMVDIEDSGLSAKLFLRRLLDYGVKAHAYNSHIVRFTFHRHISDEDTNAMINIVRKVLSED